MKATKKDVEALAVWMHDVFLADPAKKDPARVFPFEELSRNAKLHYRHMAKKLLEGPPSVLQRYASRLSSAPSPNRAAGTHKRRVRR